MNAGVGDHANLLHVKHSLWTSVIKELWKQIYCSTVFFMWSFFTVFVCRHASSICSMTICWSVGQLVYCFGPDWNMNIGLNALKFLEGHSWPLRPDLNLLEYPPDFSSSATSRSKFSLLLWNFSTALFHTDCRTVLQQSPFFTTPLCFYTEPNNVSVMSSFRQHDDSVKHKESWQTWGVTQQYGSLMSCISYRLDTSF